MQSVLATVPVRVADVGGWTDTWFGAPGQVCHVAVGPAVAANARLVDGDDGRAPVRLHAVDLGATFAIGPSAAGRWAASTPGLDPLLEHAVAAVLEGVALPARAAIEIELRSAVPPGASLGTSAAVVVAVLGALDALLDGGRTPAELAVLAHQVETVRVGRQAGVQDQWAAAMGGCGLLRISPYPDVRYEALAVGADTLAKLGDRLVTVVFGAHDSSAVHASVITAMTGCGGVEHDRARSTLGRLSSLASEAATALVAGDVESWAATLTAATEAQRELHPALVGSAHQAAIDLAQAHGASGWKVNGAGGAGGSLTVVAAEGGSEGLATALMALDETWRVLDLTPSAGLTVTPS